MTRNQRTVAILTLLGVLTSGLVPAARSQSSPSPTDSGKRLTISGTIGVAGVALRGLPVDVRTDQNGVYCVEVPWSWSGVVKPEKPGYSFTPAFREYPQIQQNQTDQNYRAKLIEFMIAGSTGLPDVVMRGLPGEVVTDNDGYYRASVPFGWVGRIMPMKSGFQFDPRERSYQSVRDNLEDQDYVARVVTLTISGSTGVPGVLMQGLPGNPVSDAQGHYRARVDYGWSGVVTPQKAGHAFTPPAREYTAVTVSMNDENYAAEPRMVTISDRVALNGEPIEGVKVTADPGGYSATTDARGRYRLEVPYGWSGRLTMSKPGFAFAGQTEYRNVTADITDGKSAPAAEDWPQLPAGIPPAGTPVPTSDVLVIPTREPVAKGIAETTEDMRVMLQILRDKLSEPRMILGVLRDYGSFFGEDRKAAAFYLQGTAAVFTVHADFPRSVPAQQPGAGGAQGQAVDPVWQRARQKLYSPAGSRGSVQPGQTQQMTFEQFRDELLRNLRHAANIRHIDPNELVILTIVALNEDADWSGGASVNDVLSGARDNPQETMLRQVYGDEYAAMMIAAQQPAPATTVLTMQAKKADIDAFAKGDLDFEQFRPKVKSFTY